MPKPQTIEDLKEFALDNDFTVEDIAFFIFRVHPDVYQTLFVTNESTFESISDIFDSIIKNKIHIDCFVMLMEMIGRIHILEFFKLIEFESVEFYAKYILTEQEYRDINLQTRSKRKLRKIYTSTIMDIINNDELSPADYKTIKDDSNAWFQQLNTYIALNRNFHR